MLKNRGHPGVGGHGFLLFCAEAYFFALSGVAVEEFYQVVVLHRKGFRLDLEHAVGENDAAAAFDVDGNFAAVVHAVENDAVAVFQNRLREEHLTAAENVAVDGSQKLDADALIMVGVIEGAADGGAVGIVIGFVIGIVDKKAGLVGVEAAV